MEYAEALVDDGAQVTKIEGGYYEFTSDGSAACGLELSINVAILFLANDYAGRMFNSLVMPRLQRMYNEYKIKQDSTTDFSKMGPVEKQVGGSLPSACAVRQHRDAP